MATSNRRLTLAFLAAVLATPGIAGPGDIEGFTVSRLSDGTFDRIAWNEYFGDTDHWRSITLYSDGLVFFVVEPGGRNAKQWWTLHQWIFPRTQRLRLSKLPGALRYGLTDSTGRLWTLVGTRVGKNKLSIAVESIGSRKQPAVDPSKTPRGIMGVDLRADNTFYLEHKVVSFSPYASIQDPKFLRTKSTFHDRHGKRCAVANRELFGRKKDGKARTSAFLFDTDAELADFLAAKCPKLDLEPLRTTTPPPPPTWRFNR